ncbi:MAG: hypothetical protein RPR97_01375 [Colwellia sp.]
MKTKNIDRWLPYYFKRLVNQPKIENRPIDIMFLFVDHFELNGKGERLQAWTEGYPAIAKKHVDSDGQHPKHTFFYALDLMHEHELVAMKPVVASGYGELELHWHHDHDTPDSFVEKLDTAMETFHKHGYMKPYKAGQKSCFSFIHGNWSLGNSRGEHFCGVDNEVEILKQQGCYADFTYPALFSEAQPPMVNNIYYCSNLDQPKCYFKGRNAAINTPQTDDEFMIFQGPMSINWLDWRHKWHPTIEDGDINQFPTHDDPKRINAWMKQGIHVEGRPEWQFVKIFCHGAQDHKSVVSDTTDRMHDYIEQHYNDGKNYRLHYVSAREAYNIIKAAEDGKKGNPNIYRDYIIPHPQERNMEVTTCAV